MSEELLEKLRRVQDLESQRTRRAVSLEEAIAAMAEEYIERRDPVVKAKRAEIKASKVSEANESGKATAVPVRRDNIDSVAGPNSSASQYTVAPVRRQTIPAQNKHEVTRQLDGQCSHIHPGTKLRCTQKRWLDFHHLKPVSQGGTNAVANLTLLCQGHHRALHATLQS